MTPRLRTFFIWLFLSVGCLALFALQGDSLGRLPNVLAVVVAGVVVVGIAIAVLRRQAGGGVANSVFELRKTRARRADGQTRVTFADVGGNTEAKDRLRDVVDFLKNPGRWTAAGVRLPRGVLLEGPPGSGKTLLARAVAGEAGVAFFEVSASEFVEMFVGVGAARVRDTFEAAAKAAPAVLFIDEIDAIGRRRGSGIGGSHDEREQTLNQLLVCLDGFRPNQRLVVVAATNRADILDAALLRPGRFDVRISLPMLGEAERLAVLQVHSRGKAYAADVDLAALARHLEGWSGAAIEVLCNEAAMRAVRRGEGPVTAADFEAVATQRSRAESHYDAVDAILTESASQLARPPGHALVELTLEDGAVVRGRVQWADAAFLKIEAEDGAAIVVPKRRIAQLRAGAGTVGVAELSGDRWVAARTDVG